MIAFRVVGKPAPQGSKKAFVVKGRAVLAESSGNVKPWRQLVAMTAAEHAPETPLEDALFVNVNFFLPVPKSAPKRRRLHASKKPDVDKLGRAVLDALTGVIWRDDAQVVQMFLSKQLAYDVPIGARIEVLTMEEWYGQGIVEATDDDNAGRAADDATGASRSADADRDEA